MMTLIVHYLSYKFLLKRKVPCCLKPLQSSLSYRKKEEKNIKSRSLTVEFSKKRQGRKRTRFGHDRPDRGNGREGFNTRQRNDSVDPARVPSGMSRP